MTPTREFWRFKLSVQVLAFDSGDSAAALLWFVKENVWLVTCYALKKLLLQQWSCNSNCKLLNNGPSRKLAIRSLNFHVSSQRFHGRSKSTSWPSNIRSGFVTTNNSIRPTLLRHTQRAADWSQSIHHLRHPAEVVWALVCPRGHKVAGDYIAMKSACHRLARVWHEFRLRQILSSVRPLLDYGRAAVHLPMPNVGEDRLSKHLATASNADL